MSRIVHRDFDLSRAERTGRKWSYRRTVMFVTAFGGLFWTAVIILCLTQF